MVDIAEVKFKLDENIPRSAKRLLESYGFDAHTVHEEDKLGISDSELNSICLHENRIIITSDDDFINPVLFKKDNLFGVLYLKFKLRNPTVVNQALQNIFSETNPSEFIGRRVKYTQIGKSKDFIIEYLDY